MIDLLRYDRARIEALDRDVTRVDDIPVVDGGLPPDFVLVAAALALAAGKSPLWFSPVAFVAIGPRRIVGSAIFKGAPVDGTVEIGYGIAPRCQGRGYATAGVDALVALALARAEVDAVHAETSVVNVASRRVLQKNGFRFTGQRLTDDDGLVDCWFVDRASV